MPGNYLKVVFQLLLIYCHLIFIHCALERNERFFGTFDDDSFGTKTPRKNFGPRRSLLPGLFSGKGTRRSGDEGNVFRAIWNVPDYCGEKFGIELPLSDFGIESNKDHSRWAGSVISVFPETFFGLYPYVTTNGTFINGGIPQLGDITSHLDKAANDLLIAIPDPEYDGLGVFDLEYWLAYWERNEQRYRTYSMDHVRSRHPDWDNATIETVAKLEWTKGAQLYMASTLKLAKQLRPKALWGYYHYPHCVVSGSSPKCDPEWPKGNDEIMWLFNEATIMYPNIYLIPHKMPYAESSVEGRLAEAFRIREKSSNPKGPVMSYARFNYSLTDFYLSFQDLHHTILKSAEFGTHGVVFWGDKYDDNTAQTCQELKDYVIKALGPTVVMAREGAESCSVRVCSGRGRCVGEILTCVKGDHSQTMIKAKKGKHQNGSVCSCRCFIGWGGEDCSTATRY